MALTVRPGRHAPLGAKYDGEGVNFAVFSENATGMDLCLFDEQGLGDRPRIAAAVQFLAAAL